MAEKRTLVLNADYRPIAVVPMTRAVVMVYLDRATVIKTTGEYLHSQWKAVEIPLVVRLKEYAHVPFRRKVPVTRRAVLKRDNYICCYCLGRADTMDHVHPRALGGLHSWNNVVAACRRCNGVKAAHLLADTNLVMHFKPFEPEGSSALAVVTSPVDESWDEYLAYA